MTYFQDGNFSPEPINFFNSGVSTAEALISTKVAPILVRSDKGLTHEV
jgi:hypothetical protein